MLIRALRRIGRAGPSLCRLLTNHDEKGVSMPSCPICGRPVERRYDKGPYPTFDRATCRELAYRRRRKQRLHCSIKALTAAVTDLDAERTR